MKPIKIFYQCRNKVTRQFFRININNLCSKKICFAGIIKTNARMPILKMLYHFMGRFEHFGCVSYLIWKTFFSLKDKLTSSKEIPTEWTLTILYSGPVPSAHKTLKRERIVYQYILLVHKTPMGKSLI